MVRDNIAQRVPIRRWAPVAFLVAGVARVSNEVLYQLGTVTTPVPEWALDLTIVVTFGGAFVGFLGVYVWVSEQSTRLSRAGLLVVGLTAGSIVGSIVGKYLVGGESPQGLILVISLSFYLFSTLSFLVFGLACVRTRTPSPTVGYLLLTVVASRVLTVAGLGELGTVLFALPLFAIWYLLREAVPHSRVAVSADETVA